MWAYIIGGLCLLYFVGVCIFGGVGTNFYLIWAVMGATLLSYGVLSKRGWFEQHIPVFFRRSFLVCFLLGVVLLVVVEGLIVSGFSAKGKKNLDYIVVLGAQVKPDRPSKVLAMRLDRAYDYLTENENTVAIVSGGQGSDEPETEAACMRRYLVEKGISPERILLEDQSTNTVENLQFSRRIMAEHKAIMEKGAGQEGGASQGNAAEQNDGVRDVSVGIISNNFHIFRAVNIAKKQGYENVCGIAARSDLPTQPNNMLREFFGVMKDYLFGNM
ncbi:MAG: YdcF family protein [Clostridiales bacterium]|nr:YdcF family protein [Clostridiales bacterium]